MQKDPSLRPSAQQIVTMPFLNRAFGEFDKQSADFQFAGQMERLLTKTELPKEIQFGETLNFSWESREI